MDLKDFRQFEKNIENKLNDKLKNILTSDDLKSIPNESDIRSIVREEVNEFKTKDEIREMATQDDIDKLRDRMENRMDGIERMIEDLKNDIRAVMGDPENPSR